MMLLRHPHRRLRHSTNADSPAGLRRIKRSLSGRSLSTSMHNLHAHNSRSSHSSGKTTHGHGILMTALKRQASLTEKDMFSASYKAHQDQLDNLASEFKASRHAQTSPPTIQQRDPGGMTIALQDHHNHRNNSSGHFRQKRLASLQVASQPPSSVRQEYGDGYTVLKDQSPTSVGNHIPHSSSSAQENTSDGSTSHSHAGNRSSTPALMMNQIKYDWVMSPTLAEIPTKSRFGCGPLDGVEEGHE